MRRVPPGPLFAALLLSGCGAGDAPGLAASDVSILAPLPGQDTVVAYLTISNRDSAAVEITRVTSPQFATVEMHATVFGDGVAEMLRIDTFRVGGASDVEFAMGGRHLMLMDPVAALAPGDDVTLEFHFGAEEPFRVRAPLEPRVSGDR